MILGISIWTLFVFWAGSQWFAPLWDHAKEWFDHLHSAAKGPK